MRQMRREVGYNDRRSRRDDDRDRYARQGEYTLFGGRRDYGGTELRRSQSDGAWNSRGREADSETIRIEEEIPDDNSSHVEESTEMTLEGEETSGIAERRLSKKRRRRLLQERLQKRLESKKRR